jgi:hypothetical protein
MCQLNAIVQVVDDVRAMACGGGREERLPHCALVVVIPHDEALLPRSTLSCSVRTYSMQEVRTLGNLHARGPSCAMECMILIMMHMKCVCGRQRPWCSLACAAVVSYVVGRAVNTIIQL